MRLNVSVDVILVHELFVDCDQCFFCYADTCPKDSNGDFICRVKDAQGNRGYFVQESTFTVNSITED